MKPRARDPVKGRATRNQWVLELPRNIEAPGVARRWLIESFAEELDREAREKARLLVSELVTNAVVHGRGRIEIHVQLDRERLLVEVIDEGPGFTPKVRERDPATPGGDGFRIVAEEATGWGIREGGARVWFELRRHRAASEREITAPIADVRRTRREATACQRDESTNAPGSDIGAGRAPRCAERATPRRSPTDPRVRSERSSTQASAAAALRRPEVVSRRLVATTAISDTTPTVPPCDRPATRAQEATGRAVQDACRMSYAGLGAPRGKGIAPTDLCR